ncbi:piercer of microtubule wall 1 protein [Astyanax mexicanus]|uniref:piercer of microtubule wall 1 protein n=1 Tax=Astyanax mexicanus TaxID=7994 RepID=UPI0020CAD0E7|nr:piercer of microtubule wall 1 protein [Astyanax mexicanus]
MEEEFSAERLKPEDSPDKNSCRTSDFYRVKPNLPKRFNHPEKLRGYSKKTLHPLYQTTNQTYGSKKPTVHEMPTAFHGTCRKFSENTRGMYKDNGFNTTLEKSPITGPNAINVLQDRITFHRSVCSERNQETGAET